MSNQIDHRQNKKTKQIAIIMIILNVISLPIVLTTQIGHAKTGYLNIMLGVDLIYVAMVLLAYRYLILRWLAYYILRMRNWIQHHYFLTQGMLILINSILTFIILKINQPLNANGIFSLLIIAWGFGWLLASFRINYYQLSIKKQHHLSDLILKSMCALYFMAYIWFCIQFNIHPIFMGWH